MTDWRDSLVTRPGKNGALIPRAVPANAVTIFSNDDAWAGVLAFDAFLESVVTVQPPPWDCDDAPAAVRCGEWAEEDSTRASNWLSRHYAIDLKPAAIDQSVAVVAARRRVHPVRDWLASLKWDGAARLDGLFVEYFGADNTDYVRGVGARFMIGAVARVYRPGAKVDCTPVLEGSQGIGKSTGVRKLAGDEWFFDSPLNFGDKDSFQALRGKWIGELGELHSLSRSDLNRTKAFLTATADHYRPSFARRARSFPRQCVLVGTTNAAEYLRDETGNRRFWPVRCTRVDFAAIDRDRDQLWAEARARFELGEVWHVDSSAFAALCEAEQDARFTEDAWLESIRDWVMSVGNPDRRRVGVTIGDVLKGALSIEASRWTKADQDRAASVLRRLGWERGKQAREAGERIRRWSPKAVTLVTVPGDGRSSEKTSPISLLSPASPANTPVTRTYARAHGVYETPCDAGDAGDVVTASRVGGGE